MKINRFSTQMGRALLSLQMDFPQIQGSRRWENLSAALLHRRGAELLAGAQRAVAVGPLNSPSIPE